MSNAILINEVNELILEELTINDNVKIFSKQIENVILRKLGDEYQHIMFGTNPFETISFTENINCDLINEQPFNLQLNVNCYVFEKLKKLKETFGTNSTSNGRLLFRKIRNKYIVVLSIDFCCVKSNPTSDFYDTVQHEVNHLFQQMFAGKSYPLNKRYLTSLNGLYNTNDKEKCIAQLMYFLDNTEIDAFVNGMYAFVEHNVFNSDNTNIDYWVQKSEAWSNLKTVQQNLLYINALKDDSDLNQIFKKYNYSTKKFLKLCNNKYKRFLTKIGKCVIRLKDDIYGVNEGNVRFTFAHLNEAFFKNKPLFYEIYKIWQCP